MSMHNIPELVKHKPRYAFQDWMNMSEDRKKDEFFTNVPEEEVDGDQEYLYQRHKRKKPMPIKRKVTDDVDMIRRANESYFHATNLFNRIADDNNGFEQSFMSHFKK